MIRHRVQAAFVVADKCSDANTTAAAAAAANAMAAAKCLQSQSQVANHLLRKRWCQLPLAWP